MVSETQGVTVHEIEYPNDGIRVERFYSDAEILDLFPDGDNSLVNPLLRRAQAAEAKIEWLQAELIDTRNAIKIIIGRSDDIPWPDVPERDVDGYVECAKCRREAASAAGGK